LGELHDAELKYCEKHENMKKYDYNNNVLNGIAWDEQKDEYYVTGKRWNFMFRIKIKQHN
jgi:glutamine cyclotransferase